MTEEKPLTEGQMQALAEVLAAADDLLHKVALPILLQSGNPNRVKATLAAAAMMALWTFRDKADETPLIVQLERLGEMTETIIHKMLEDGDSGVKAFNFHRLHKAHSVISNIVAGTTSQRTQ